MQIQVHFVPHTDGLQLVRGWSEPYFEIGDLSNPDLHLDNENCPCGTASGRLSWFGGQLMLGAMKLVGAPNWLKEIVPKEDLYCGLTVKYGNNLTIN